MKFTNGYWMTRQGVSIDGAVDIRDVQITEKRVIVYATNQKVLHRGQTLSTPILTVEFTSPMKNVISVQSYHHKGVGKKTPSFAINHQFLPLDTKDTPGELIISSGDLSVHIGKDSFRMEYYYGSKLLTSSDTNKLAYITAPDGKYFKEALSLGVGECIYGLGERFTSFVKNGQTVDMWNEDGGTASEQAYKNIPFYVSSNGYGVFINHPEAVSLEIGSETVSRVQFSVPGECLNYFVIAGASEEDLKGVVSNYAELTGKPALPPAWSFGLWLSTSFTTDYNEETVTGFIDGMFNRGIPLSVFHFDCFWMREYEWCNFQWDETQFEDVEGMLARLKHKGLHICVWINPYIGQKSPLFDEAAESGFLIKNKAGDVWQWDQWQSGMGIVDFTNPGARAWYADKLRPLLEQGVDCFKTDFGERIPVDAQYFDGSDPYKMHNYYSYLYNKTVFDLLKEYKGANHAVVFARSATTGSQSFPVHWGGDCEATYSSMAETLRGGLSLSLGAFGFWSHDISGFESTATADLYKRWVAFGLLSTHSRLHGSGSYRVPWLFDEEAVDVLRFFTTLKHSLMPYLFSNACQTCLTGIPIMRPMILEYPGDPVCKYLDTQYMLGSSLLVAPVFNQNGTTETYLPGGKWTHFLTNETAEGGKYICAQYDYFSLPLWVAPNSIIPVGNGAGSVVYDYTKDITCHVYELSDAISEIYDDQGRLMLTIHATNTDGRVEIDMDGDAVGLSFIFHNIELADEVDGAEAEAVPEGMKITVPGGQKHICFFVHA